MDELKMGPLKSNKIKPQTSFTKKKQNKKQ